NSINSFYGVFFADFCTKISKSFPTFDDDKRENHTVQKKNILDIVQKLTQKPHVTSDTLEQETEQKPEIEPENKPETKQNLEVFLKNLATLLKETSTEYPNNDEQDGSWDSLEDTTSGIPTENSNGGNSWLDSWNLWNPSSKKISQSPSSTPPEQDQKPSDTTLIAPNSSEQQQPNPQNTPVVLAKPNMSFTKEVNGFFAAANTSTQKVLSLLGTNEPTNAAANIEEISAAEIPSNASTTQINTSTFFSQVSAAAKTGYKQVIESAESEAELKGAYKAIELQNEEIERYFNLKLTR
ncbi:MAG: hypothetical protein AAGG80_07555, partial [Pseudomonadota bacterium]